MSIVSEDQLDRLTLETKKIEGSLRWFDHVRGYGFIVPQGGGDDILLHNEILRDYGKATRLQPGSVVSCEIMKSPKGLMATKILKILDNVDNMSKDFLNNYNPSEAPEEMISRPDDETLLKVAIVKWYDERKGYGFCVTHEDDNDIMLSRQILRKCGIRALYPADKIRIVTDKTDRGLIASYIEYV